MLAYYAQQDGSHVLCVHNMEPVFGDLDCGVDEAVEMLVSIYEAIFGVMETTGCTKLRHPPPGLSNRASYWQSSLGSCTFTALQEIYDKCSKDRRDRLLAYEMEICINHSEAHALFASSWMNAEMVPNAMKIPGASGTKQRPLQAPSRDPPVNPVRFRLKEDAPRMECARTERGA